GAGGGAAGRSAPGHRGPVPGDGRPSRSRARPARVPGPLGPRRGRVTAAAEDRAMADGRWTEDLLDRMRGAGDPLADSTVGQVFAKGRVAAVNELLTRLVRNDDVPAGP